MADVHLSGSFLPDLKPDLNGRLEMEISKPIPS